LSRSCTIGQLERAHWVSAEFAQSDWVRLGWDPVRFRSGSAGVRFGKGGGLEGVGVRLRVNCCKIRSRFWFCGGRSAGVQLGRGSGLLRLGSTGVRLGRGKWVVVRRTVDPPYFAPTLVADNLGPVAICQSESFPRSVSRLSAAKPTQDRA
jgi:hypothetical protein